jgi:hypothetical protein
MKRFWIFFYRRSTREDQPLEIGGKFLFDPDLALWGAPSRLPLAGWVFSSPAKGSPSGRAAEPAPNWPSPLDGVFAVNE